MCFKHSTPPIKLDETTDLEDVTKLREVYYFPNIGNDLVSLKLSSGMTKVEEDIANYNIFDMNYHFEGVTSLDQMASEEYKNATYESKNIYDYLTEEQIKKGIITDEEVQELLEQLNEEDYRHTRDNN